MSPASRSMKRLRDLYRSAFSRMRPNETRPAERLAGGVRFVPLEPLERRIMLSATHYVVNSLADVVTDDGVVTLREAMEAANTNTAVTDDVLAGSDTETDLITFDHAALAAEAAVAVGEPLTITLDSFELEITDDLEITGLGPDVLTLDADGRSRVFYVTGGQTEVSLSGLTITGGLFGFGSGIYIHDGTLALSNANISGNAVVGEYSSGGGIFNSGTLTLTNVTVSGNAAGSRGGGIYNAGTMTLSDVTISGNGAANEGGGIYNRRDATMRLSNVTVSGNEAHEGGGIYNWGSPLTCSNVTLIGNAADEYGGGIFNDDGTMTLSNATISGNTAGSRGGGIWNGFGTVTLSNVTVSGNEASVGNGGGIYNTGTGTLTLSNVTVSGNSGGGIHSFDGTLTLSNVTVRGNRTSGDGGGIWELFATVTLTNVTVSGNTAGSCGGGIFTLYGDTLTLSNVTVSGNAASSYGGGIYNDSGTLTLNNSIVAMNDAGSHADVRGSVIGSHNLFGIDPGFVRSPSAGADGVWGTADDDYGDLRLLPTSPAVNAGDNALLPADELDLDGDGDTTEPLPFDLAGNRRVVGPSVDIGAYEYQQELNTTPSQQWVYNSAFLTDEQIGDYGSMAVEQVRGFLADHGSYFRGPVADVDGVVFDLATVIVDAAHQHSINPQVLLATLEKESVGVTTPTRPSDTRMRLLMGAGAASTARAQVFEAARLLRAYLDELDAAGATRSGWEVGTAKMTEDGVSVTPATCAVAALFTYTPYAGAQWGGNQPQWGGTYLFFHYWNSFGFESTLPALAAPTGLAASAVSDSAIALSWDALAGASGYRLERRDGLSGEWECIATPSAETTSFENTGLTADTTYYYRLAASSNAASSPYCRTVSASPLDALVPRISAVNPSTPVATGSPQEFIITGENFHTEAVIGLRPPGGAPFCVPGTVSAEQVTLDVVFDTPGEWVVEVINPGNLPPADFHFLIVDSVVPSAADYFFSQKDPGWAENQVGASGATIGQIGCAMTSTAMVLRSWGVETNPGALNAWLSVNGGYTPAGAIYWGKVGEYSNGEVQYVANRSWTGSVADNDHWSELKGLLDEGYRVIVKVDGIPATPALDEHWVLVTGFTGEHSNDPTGYAINDPESLEYVAGRTLDYYGTFTAMRVFGLSPTSVVNGSFVNGSLAGWATGGPGAVDTSDWFTAGAHAARLSVSSPVTLYQTVSTPDTAFDLMFDCWFPETSGSLDVLLDSVVVGSVPAPDSVQAEYETFRVRVDDPALLGLDGAVLAFSLDGPSGSQMLVSNIAVLPADMGVLLTEVVDRQVFHNNSGWDGEDPGANPDDDNAIAVGKQPLLPGETATVANYTPYSRGINGIMVDIAGLPGTPTASDFVFKSGNSNDPGTWTAAPAPLSITVRPGDGTGGSDRVTLIWADNAVENQWLQVVVKATPRTGLADPDVFYVGNLAAEFTGDAVVDLDDLAVFKQSFATSGTGGGDCDMNGTVDLDDFVTLKNAFGLELASIEAPTHVQQPGDANADGCVDLDDFVLLKQNFGTTSGATWAMGDFNASGSVDLDDLMILKQNFGEGAVSAPVDVQALALATNDVVAGDSAVPPGMPRSHRRSERSRRHRRRAIAGATGEPSPEVDLLGWPSFVRPLGMRGW
ncbi:MAG: right-handed parallel beta-helix repeat-containing protein [Planctomycetota bacterium]